MEKNIKYFPKRPNKHFLFYVTSWKDLEDVFNLTIFNLPRRLPDVFTRPSFQRRVWKTSSSRRLQEDVLQTRLADVLKMYHWRRLQHVFTKTSVFWGSCPKQGQSTTKYLYKIFLLKHILGFKYKTAKVNCPVKCS